LEVAPFLRFMAAIRILLASGSFGSPMFNEQDQP
jgi:hypothetical protein